MTSLLAAFIIVFITSLINFFIFFLYQPSDKLKKTWSFFSLAVSLWAGGIIFSQSTTSEYLALLGSRFGNICAIMIPVFFLHCCVLLSSAKSLEKNILQKTYAISILYLVTSAIFYEHFVASVSTKLNYIYWGNPGPLYYFFPALFFFVIIAAFYILLKNYPQLPTHQQKKIKNSHDQHVFGLSRRNNYVRTYF